MYLSQFDTQICAQFIDMTNFFLSECKSFGDDEMLCEIVSTLVITHVDTF